MVGDAAGPLVEVVHLDVGGRAFVAVRIAARAHLRQYRSGAISPADRGVALVSFNGGFNPSGYGAQSGFLGGPGALANGLGAVVGYTDGTFGLGQWGRDVPAPGKQLAWARSNLDLIVDGGRPSPAIGNVAQWGDWLHTVGPATARSALGIDGAGNLLYVASMGTLPSQLADALVSVGAVRAMILDMNPYWICAFAYAPGATVNLVGNPNRPTDVFSSGWDRDFFVATR